ncbi:MAG: DUF3093 domain-containing protein [Nocardioides sp.]
MSGALGAVTYRERLHVPVRWWLLGAALIATFWLALSRAVPGWLPWLISGLAFALLGLGFAAYAATVTVGAEEFRAGPAHIGLNHLDALSVLDAEQTRSLVGVDADARAFLVLRPYLSGSVRVDIGDPADATPYWLVSSRRPHDLAEALDVAIRARAARYDG